MVRKYSQDSVDFSEPRTTAMSSMVMESSIVFNKARTCMKGKNFAQCHMDVKPFSEIPIVCAKPLSTNGEETPEQKLEKLKKFKQMREENKTAEYCKSLSDI